MELKVSRLKVSLRKTRVRPTNKINTVCLCECQAKEGTGVTMARVMTLHPTKISKFYRLSRCSTTIAAYSICLASALLPRSSTHFAAILPISLRHRPCVLRHPSHDLRGASSRYLMAEVTHTMRPCVVDLAYHSNRDA